MWVGLAKTGTAVALGVVALCLSGRAHAEEALPGASTAAELSARPPLPAVSAPAALPWERHLEFGADIALVSLLASADAAGRAMPVRYAPGVGFALHLNLEVLRYLGFTGYLVDSRHALRLPPGSLGPAGDIEASSAHTFRFGARFSPTLPLTERVRLWGTVGVGWGRLEFSRMTLREPGQDPFTVRERADSVVELPLGVGAAFEVWPRWMTLQFEVLYGFGLGQEGTGQEGAQAIDALGRKRAIAGLPRVEGIFVQTLGLSIVL